MPVTLGDLADIFVGLQTSADDVFIMELVEETRNTFRIYSRALDKEVSLEKDLLHPLVSGTDVNRYAVLPRRQYILFPYDVENEAPALIKFPLLSVRYPRSASYLRENRKRLEDRERGKFKGIGWYKFGRSQNLGIQGRVKICVPRLVDSLGATIDLRGTHFLDNVDVGGVTLKPLHEALGLPYSLALLNSSLLRWYFPSVSAPFRGGYRSANRQFLSQLPIRVVNFMDPTDKLLHGKVVDLVEHMMQLHEKKHSGSLAPSELDRVERDIASTDAKIDDLVFELYGVTDKERRIVEEEKAGKNLG
jgi:RNase P/RNase MRP subunit p29